MKRVSMKIAKALTLSLVLPALLIPTTGSGFPTDTDTYQVNAVRVGSFTFADPTGPANNPSHPDWTSATATDVPLEYIVFASANAKDSFDDWAKVNPEAVRHLSIKSIHDGGEILFRVEFEDETFDENARDVPRFFDALALMIPYPESDYPGCVPGETSEPMIHMGMRCDGRDEHGLLPGEPGFDFARCCPVNLHFWRPDKVEVENIVTNGAGTTLETDETDDPTLFHAAQEWSNDRWTVIMGRAMVGPPNPDPAHPDATDVGPGGYMVTLEAGGTYATVWANWDGDRDERNGSKFIGLFGTLIIAP
ncbi:MAG: hypothetical protein U9Q81_09290 [Pseudomonadota bacterium]|nr:hypothetical protein [Pseudomonadota bacterium]